MPCRALRKSRSHSFSPYRHIKPAVAANHPLVVSIRDDRNVSLPVWSKDVPLAGVAAVGRLRGTGVSVSAMRANHRVPDSIKQGSRVTPQGWRADWTLRVKKHHGNDMRICLLRAASRM